MIHPVYIMDFNWIESRENVHLYIRYHNPDTQVSGNSPYKFDIVSKIIKKYFIYFAEHYSTHAHPYYPGFIADTFIPILRMCNQAPHVRPRPLWVEI